MKTRFYALFAFIAVVFAIAPVRADHLPGFVLNGRKWEPGGAATGNAGEFPSPGSATFSIMGADKANAAGALEHDEDDDPNHSGLTKAITELGVAGWDADDYADMIEWALDQWDAVSAFTNLGVDPDGDGGGDAGAAGDAGAKGNIRVAAWEIIEEGVLAHAFRPNTAALSGAGFNIGGDVHFDIDQTWVDEIGDDDTDDDFDIFTVALHEVGHALGLSHSHNVNSVMYADYSGARRTLTADDIAGIRAIYGVPEPGTIVGMFSLATFGVGIFIARRRRDKKLAA
ncbi:MAG: matrixin family metalloprotease [Planctomycetaceae bacterium]